MDPILFVNSGDHNALTQGQPIQQQICVEVFMQWGKLGGCSCVDPNGPDWYTLPGKTSYFKYLI